MAGVARPQSEIPRHMIEAFSELQDCSTNRDLEALLTCGATPAELAKRIELAERINQYVVKFMTENTPTSSPTLEQQQNLQSVIIRCISQNEISIVRSIMEESMESLSSASQDILVHLIAHTTDKLVREIAGLVLNSFADSLTSQNQQVLIGLLQNPDHQKGLVAVRILLPFANSLDSSTRELMIDVLKKEPSVSSEGEDVSEMPDLSAAIVMLEGKLSPEEQKETLKIPKETAQQMVGIMIGSRLDRLQLDQELALSREWDKQSQKRWDEHEKWRAASVDERRRLLKCMVCATAALVVIGAGAIGYVCYVASNYVWSEEL